MKANGKVCSKMPTNRSGRDFKQLAVHVALVRYSPATRDKYSNPVVNYQQFVIEWSVLMKALPRCLSYKVSHFQELQLLERVSRMVNFK